MTAASQRLPDDIPAMREQVSQTRAELADTVTALRTQAVADAKTRAKQAGVAVGGLAALYVVFRLVKHHR